jgi:hypothetical protein
MLRFFPTLVRALLAHCCCEALRMFLAHFVPGVPPVICIAISLVLGVAIAEIAAMLWRHGTRANEDP